MREAICNIVAQMFGIEDLALSSSWLHTKTEQDYTGSTAEKLKIITTYILPRQKKNHDYMSRWIQGQWIRLPANVGFDKDFFQDQTIRALP